MTADNKPIRLSEPIAWLMKYFAPFIIAFVATGWYWKSKDYHFPLILFIAGLLYWFFSFLQFKDVKLDDNYLIISNDFKKDKVHIDDIDSLTTGGWTMSTTRIHFKRQTKFGQTITFATMTAGFGGGISDRVKNILQQIQDNIAEQKK